MNPGTAEVNFPVNMPGKTPLTGTQRLECIETFNGAKTGLLGIPGAHRRSVLTSTTWSGQYCDAFSGCNDNWFHNSTKFSVSSVGPQRLEDGVSWHVSMTYTPEEAFSSTTPSGKPVPFASSIAGQPFAWKSLEATIGISKIPSDVAPHQIDPNVTLGVSAFGFENVGVYSDAMPMPAEIKQSFDAGHEVYIWVEMLTRTAHDPVGWNAAVDSVLGTPACALPTLCNKVTPQGHILAFPATYYCVLKE